MPVETGSQLEPKRYYLGDIASLREVRDDVTMSSIAQIISNHILSANIRPAQESWQTARWTQFLAKKSYDIIGELLLNGLVYGEAIADRIFSVDRSLYYVITDLVPLDMGLVKKRRQNEPKPDTDITAYWVQYGSKTLDTSRLAVLTLYTQGGAPYPLGLKIAGNVKRKNEMGEIQHFATGSSILGNYYAVSTGNGAYNADQTQAYLDTMGTAMQSKGQLDGCEIKQVPTAGNKMEVAQASKLVIDTNKNDIYTLYNMQWMETTQTNTGTYGAMQAWLDAYGKFVNAIADAVCGFFDQVALMEAKANGLPTITFTCDPIVLGKTEADPAGAIRTATGSPLVFKGITDSGLVTGEEIRNAYGLPPLPPPEKVDTGFSTTDIFSMVDKGIMTIDEARANLGLAVNTPPPTTTVDPNTATRENAVATWLAKTKKDAVKREVEKAVSRKAQGLGTQFKFTQIDRLVSMTSLDKETAISLATNLETQVKSLINDIATGSKTLNDFDPVWSTFEMEVKNAIQ